MRVKALSDFSGIPHSMAAGEIRDIPQDGALDVLMTAGLVEPAAEISRPKSETKVRRTRNEGKRRN